MFSERNDNTTENHEIPAGHASFRCVGPAGSLKLSSSPSVELACGGEPTAEDQALEKRGALPVLPRHLSSAPRPRAMGTDELRDPAGHASLRCVGPAGKITLEGHEEQTIFLKKQAERMGRSCFDICEVFSPPRGMRRSQ